MWFCCFTASATDAEVSCVLTESCILPLRFLVEDKVPVVIEWSQVTGNTPVHSFYNNQDQLALQDQHFRGRTSLFKDQISRGNASLRLTGVQVQDQGRYRCDISTITGNRVTYINLNVEAPVREVNIQQVENRITCSSEGIYPQPDLTWSTSPPSSVTLQDKPTVQQTEQQLYSISSSLILSDSVTDLVYSCTVSTRRNWRRASWFKQTSLLFLKHSSNGSHLEIQPQPDHPDPDRGSSDTVCSQQDSLHPDSSVTHCVEVSWNQKPSVPDRVHTLRGFKTTLFHLHNLQQPKHEKIPEQLTPVSLQVD